MFYLGNNNTCVGSLKKTTLLLFFDGGSLYLDQLLLMVCRLRQRFELTNMTLSKLQKIDILKSFLRLEFIIYTMNGV